MHGYLEQLIEFDIWATARLIEFIESQPPNILDANAPGAYGSVRETLAHLLGAEESYVERLAGRKPPPDVGTLDLAGLRSLSERVHAALHELQGSLPEPSVRFKRTRGWATASTALTQLFQHGCEHRAQIATILGTHGIEPPKLDGWAHGISIGTASLTA